MDATLAKSSPWREPMVWLLVAIPALAVFASVALLVAADRTSGNNDLVPDNVRRTGQAQVADLGKWADGRRDGGINGRVVQRYVS